MAWRLLPLFVVGIAALLPGTHAIADPAGDLTARLEALVAGNDALAPHPFPGVAVTVFQNGAVTHRAAAGQAVIDPANPARARPMTPATPVRVASISKLVATIGAMTLVEDGRLDLDADIITYLGQALRNPAFPDTAITTRMLLSHTSSLRDGPGYAFALGDRLIDRLTPDHWAPASQPPGTYFTYCNLNFGLLAQIMEAVSGVRFDRFMTTRVLNPLGLDAGYNLSGMSLTARQQIAVLYRKGQGGVLWQPEGPWQAQVDDYPSGPPALTWYGMDRPDGPAIDRYAIASNGSLFSPQGGLRASTDDLAQIALALMGAGKTVLEPGTIAQMLTPEWTWNGEQGKASNGDTAGGIFGSYGLSVHRLTGRFGDAISNNQKGLWVGHSGEAYGLQSGLWWSVDNGFGFAFTITGAAVDPYELEKGKTAFTAPEEAVMKAVVETALPLTGTARQ